MKRSIPRRGLLAAALLLSGAAAWADGAIQARDGWARPTVAGQPVGAGYLKLHNTGATPDRLLGASTGAAERVELHNMFMSGDVMRMRQVEAIDVPAGATVELGPGGLHLMLMGLKAPLTAGQRLPLVLRFEKAGEVKTELQVGQRAAAAGASAPSHQHGHGHERGHKH
ncbi:copper chaperone PCu(A)C [Azohydromonas aeria]|uniref:copper chaperone PCu(A)C n=1 Tax=Azohydromonas aeria TaxID=2590212 RepID=UPI0012F7D456|nr:copper chaperone PCu(A)C [Azohydromonas aeria]